jgi:hypothetical protein
VALAVDQGAQPTACVGLRNESINSPSWWRGFNVRRGNERLVDRGPILIDGQTGEILWSAGPHPARELMDGSFDISLALPAFCDILE